MERESMIRRLDRGAQKYIVQLYTVAITNFVAATVAIEKEIQGENSEADTVLIIPVLLSLATTYHFYREGEQDLDKR